MAEVVTLQHVIPGGDVTKGTELHVTLRLSDDEGRLVGRTKTLAIAAMGAAVGQALAAGAAPAARQGTTYTLKRSGEFVLATDGDNHCGTKELQPMRYELVVTCGGKLDKRGFLFEQLGVEEFFNSRDVDEERSCEELARDWCADLLGMVNTDSPGCEVLSMMLTLSPAPYGASVSYVPEMVGGKIV